MKGFPPIKDVKLDKSTISKVKSYFKWSMFLEGTAIISLTPSGGIHYTGTRKESPCISWEVTRGGTYYMCTLIEYPHGVIFHLHVYLTQISKSSPIDPKTIKLYSEVKNLLEK